LTLLRLRFFQAFKYAIYALLALNVYWFYVAELAAADLLFENGFDIARIIEAYAATIDTLAWVVLLLMFELETWVLDEQHFTPRVVRTLQAVRVLAYAFIVYAFYGYIVNLTYFDGAAPLAGVTDLCTLAGQWSYAVGLDEYVAITRDNCADFSQATTFFQLPGMTVLLDAEGLAASKTLAWVDVINAAVWLLIVLLLELDVRLQEHGRYRGAALLLSNAGKVILYLLLLLAAIYWGLRGGFVDFWDAILWLVAFFFIELNVVEWHHETGQSKS
jgi:hypothetical protein